MSIKLKGSTDGSVTLQAPADTSPTGTDKTLTLPTTTGSANQFVKNGSSAGSLEYSSMVETSTGQLLVGATSGTGKFIVQDSSLPKIQANFNGSKHLEAGVGGSGCGFSMTSGHFMAFNHQPYADRGTDNNLSERMRLDANGSLNLNCTQSPTANSAGPLHIFAANSKDAINLKSEHTGNVFNIWKTNTGNLISFYVGASQGSPKGEISTNGSSITYGSVSDYRLKENVVNLDGAISRVKQLLPKRFNFIASADTTVDGFLAHEAQTVVPEAVTGTHNEVDADDNPVYQGIDQSKLVPLLTAALQEAISKIETLETKVAALEAAE